MFVCIFLAFLFPCVDHDWLVSQFNLQAPKKDPMFRHKVMRSLDKNGDMIENKSSVARTLNERNTIFIEG